MGRTFHGRDSRFKIQLAFNFALLTGINENRMRVAVDASLVARKKRKPVHQLGHIARLGLAKTNRVLPDSGQNCSYSDESELACGSVDRQSNNPARPLTLSLQ
jgi:hypothetical protein